MFWWAFVLLVGVRHSGSISFFHETDKVSLQSDEQSQGKDTSSSTKEG
tara:strand:+ start:116 stop:259 length:144 start_codon:yes stop_codon:yes gene_type:complete